MGNALPRLVVKGLKCVCVCACVCVCMRACVCALYVLYMFICMLLFMCMYTRMHGLKILLSYTAGCVEACGLREAACRGLLAVFIQPLTSNLFIVFPLGQLLQAQLLQGLHRRLKHHQVREPRRKARSGVGVLRARMMPTLLPPFLPHWHRKRPTKLRLSLETTSCTWRSTMTNRGLTTRTPMVT